MLSRKSRGEAQERLKLSASLIGLSTTLLPRLPNANRMVVAEPRPLARSEVVHAFLMIVLEAMTELNPVMECVAEAAMS